MTAEAHAVGLRDLRHHTSEALARVRHGETTLVRIEIARVVARAASALLPATWCLGSHRSHVRHGEGARRWLSSARWSLEALQQLRYSLRRHVKDHRDVPAGEALLLELPSNFPRP
jgi:antitoxin (DNA-binding transcriptional repressor) of toxin-antitoxin stability system